MIDDFQKLSKDCEIVNMMENICSSTDNSAHLIVMTHGMLGDRNDLKLLQEKVEECGCTVLQSKENEDFHSFKGIKVGAELLAEEVKLFVQHCSEIGINLNRISFVGHSLGGLYARYTISLLFDKSNNTIAGLEPHFFLTLACPHIGIGGHTYVPLPRMIDRIIALILFQTGSDLFFGTEDKSSIIYRMATEEIFLFPLKSFKQRRAYASIASDFLVPLGTGAFLRKRDVDRLREQFKSSTMTGVITSFSTLGDRNDLQQVISPLSSEEDDTLVRFKAAASVECTSPATEVEVYTLHENSSLVATVTTRDSSSSIGVFLFNCLHYLFRGRESVIEDDMVDSLDSIGWEKIIVKFDGIMPFSHVKICANAKYSSWLDPLYGMSEGKPVMDHAAIWLAQTDYR